ncbi:MAG: hypothetical protein HY324_03290, partial [Chlamydiia bacterium]|nr:hypothetical protein [Chlamydiia bacterium]
DWATFKHVSRAVSRGDAGNFWEFFGAQLGILSPIFFGLLVTSYVFLRHEKNTALRLLALFPSVIFLYLSAALFKKIQPNWALYLYPAAIPLIAWAGKRAPKWLYLGMGVSLIMVVGAFSIPYLSVPYSLNPFRQVLGYECLASALQHAGYREGVNFLFADKYQTTSLLSFYAQQRVYHFNLGESRRNQFAYWPQMEEQEVGNTGYFVVIENTQESSIKWYREHYLQRLAPYFERVEYSGAFPLYSVRGIPVKYALLFKSSNYLGGSPERGREY